MRDGKRINIGLFVNSIQNDYSTLICKGAAVAAEELDVNLLIVPGRELEYKWDNIAINRYEYQCNVLYSFITSNNIDVLLVAMGTVGFFLSDEKKKAFLEKYRGIKIILLESEIDGYPSISASTDGLRQEIEHLIKVHGMKKIAFLSGPETNQAACERLSVYRQVMKENGIDYDENYVAFGDFTDYCEEIIRNWFDRLGDNIPEAVCCANDSMVKPLRNVCCERGLKPGVDIFFTGYDDASFANIMVPPLTTVKSNIMTMGYQSVKSAVKYCYTGLFEKVCVESNLILRQSCGCAPETVRATETKGISFEYDRDKLTDNIIEYTVKKSSLDVIPAAQIAAIRKFIGLVYDRITEGLGFSSEEVSIMISELMSEENMDFLTYDTLNALIYALKKLAFESKAGENREQVYATFERVFRSVSLQFAEIGSNNEQRTVFDRFVFSRIVDDMMACGSDETEALRLLMNNISLLKLKSCYVYLYHRSLIGYSSDSDRDELWKRPDHIYLKALLDGEKYVFPQPKDQRMSFDSFMTNKFISCGRRRTFILQALFFNDEQYGIMLLETGIGMFSEVANITNQICTAVKLSQFMNRLEGALDDVRKVNIQLSAESVSDQLTGIYNRRGFISKSEKLLGKYRGVHCRGAVIYADLDCLKIINDTFGHREGDFAIKKAAGILSECLGETDVTGRVGGDEFVAFITDTDDARISEICSRVKEAAVQFNQSSDKPYNIGISMGVYCFDTFDGESVDQLMSAADRELYNSKKLKNRNVFK